MCLSDKATRLLYSSAAKEDVYNLDRRQAYLATTGNDLGRMPKRPGHLNEQMLLQLQ